jgi:glycine C-acetyltransferase
VDIIAESTDLRERLERNCEFFRSGIGNIGFKTSGANHPIIPVMLGDASLAKDMAVDLLRERIYVIGFSYPVVPKGEERIRVQISAGHKIEDLEKALAAFRKIGKKYGVI